MVGHTCPDGSYTHVNNYVGFGCIGCGRCGMAWGYPGGRHPVGPHEHKKKHEKKRKKRHEKKAADWADSPPTVICPECDQKTPEAYGFCTNCRTVFSEEPLDPARVRDLTKDIGRGTREAQLKTITVCDRCGVEATGNHTHAPECPYNWPNRSPKDWTDEQRERAKPRARQADHTFDDDEPTCEQDGKPALGNFFGKHVCEEHLRYALADAPAQLKKAQEGIMSSGSTDRIRYENLAQKIKLDMKAGGEKL